jgi:4-hydroxybenzoate polyprenyltransferase
VIGVLWEWASDLLLLSRIREWGVHLLANVLVSISCLSAARTDLSEFCFFLGVVTVHYGCVLAFCYLLNDWTDREVDLRQGKKKSTRSLPLGWLTAILVTLIIIGLGVLVCIKLTVPIAVLAAVSVVGSVAYSVRPMRLKERGIWGVLAAAILQRVPVFVIFALLVSVSVTVTVYVCAWLSLLGLIFILEHQIEDWPADSAHGVKTLVVDIGIARGAALRRYVYVGFLLCVVIPPGLYLLETQGSLPQLTFVIPMTVLSSIGISLFCLRYHRNDGTNHRTGAGW